MARRLELAYFALVLAAVVGLFLGESLFEGKVLSPADVLYAQASFPGKGPDYEPWNRLLIDPVLQFQPWIAFNRSELRAGRLPTWNPFAGAGAPHVANGQSALFDPVNLIAYLGRLPDALAWMAALRLWIAGLGGFVLARSWGLGRPARWFVGLAFPFCGFLVVWLQYPVTPAAIWLPWLVWASGRLRESGGGGWALCVAMLTALPCLAGHVQTAAHLLLATALLEGCALAPLVFQQPKTAARLATTWLASVLLGMGLAAAQLVPLGAYLAKSPVWADRLSDRERQGPAVSARPLDTLCTAFPYLFGSQRRGHPNVARALGVHNLNESAGGYAGLATWCVLVPLGLGTARRNRRVRSLALLGASGFLLAFGMPPLSWAIARLPVLNVIDHRRTTLWLAFAQILIAAHGIEAIAAWRPGRKSVAAAFLAGLVFATAAVTVATQAPRIRGAIAARLAARADAPTNGGEQHRERHLRNLLSFYPRYFGGVAAELALLGSLLWLRRAARLGAAAFSACLITLVLADLFAFGYGLNPAIDRTDAAPASPVIDRLRQLAPFPARVLALDGELPPNTLMRYGLCDIRNYDSIELGSMLAFLEPLFADDPEPGRSSRREVSWRCVLANLDRLERADVRAIVSRDEPPGELIEHAEVVGRVWITVLRGAKNAIAYITPSEIRIDASTIWRQGESIPITFDSGWRVPRNERLVIVERAAGTPFLTFSTAAGAHTEYVLRYEPDELRVGMAVSGVSVVVGCLGVLAGRRERPGRKSTIEGLDAPREER